MYVAPNLMYVRVQRLFSETDRERGTSCVVVETDSSEGDSGGLRPVNKFPTFFLLSDLSPSLSSLFSLLSFFAPLEKKNIIIVIIIIINNPAPPRLSNLFVSNSLALSLLSGN